MNRRIVFRASRLLRRGLVLAVLLALALALPGRAAATGWLQWSEEGNSFVTFTEESMPVTIDIGKFDVVRHCIDEDGDGRNIGVDDVFFPATDIYIVHSKHDEQFGKGSHAVHVPIIDESGAANPVQGVSGGLFLGETIGFTGLAGSLIDGLYAVIFDECQNGQIDSVDTIIDPAFKVETPISDHPGIPVLTNHIFNLKAAAGAEGESWSTLLKRYQAVMDAIEWYERASCVANLAACTISSIADKVKEIAVGGLGSADVQAAAVATVGNLAKHYAAIKADPPDPTFRRLTTLVPPARIDVASGDQLLDSALGIGAQAGNEAALAEALLHSLERYQGAEAADDAEWALVHARAIERYSTLLATQLGRTNAVLDDFASALSADSRGLDDVSLMLAQRDQHLADEGLTQDEKRELRNAGLTEGEIAEAVARILAGRARNVREDELQSALQELRSANAYARGVYQQLATDANAISATLDLVVSETAPKADAGGPYTTIEGASTTLDGSASRDPNGTIVRFEWDLNEDGAFDDATGAAPAVSFRRAFSGLIGLRVTDSEGRIGIGYAHVTASEANRPPQGTYVPSAWRVEQPVGTPRSFTVSATDEDGDAVHVEWLLDGDRVASGPSFTFTPSAAGVSSLTAVVTDSSPLGGSVKREWLVVGLREDGDGDGWRVNVDCDDAQAAVNPGAVELLGNGRDDDCDPTSLDVLVFNATYEASTAEFPSSTCPLWRPKDTAPGADPSIAGGVLTLTTNSDEEEMYFLASGSQLRFPSRFVLEARVRYVAGTAAAASRAAILIGATTAPGVGFILFVGRDDVFLMGPNDGRGASAAVDTDDAFHTYRIDVAPGGALKVFQDDALVLESTVVENGSLHPQVARVVWGDATRFASGQSEWQFLRHNANALPCRAPQEVDFDLVYDPAGGKLPGETCQRWTVSDNSSLAAEIVDGRLVVQTGANFKELQFYTQNPPALELEDPLVVEARVRLRSTVDGVPWRTAAVIGLAREPGAGNALLIGQDRIFLLKGTSVSDTIGPEISVDTDDAFHTYRLELGRDGIVYAFYDGTLVLAAPVFHNEFAHGTLPRIYWGEGTLFASGSSEWERVGHNGGTPEVCNEPPDLLDDNVHATEDTLLTIPTADLARNDLDPEGATLQVTTVTAGPETRGLVVLSAGSLVYTPEPNFHGIDRFAYTACDDGANGGAAHVRCGTGTVAVRVEPANDRPEALDGSLLVARGETSAAVDLGALVSDLETADADLHYSVVSAPEKGALTGTGPTLTYTPAARAGGADAFTYAVVDRGDPDGCVPNVDCDAPRTSHVRTVAIQIEATTSAPVAADAQFATDEDTAVAVELTASDADGDELSYEVVSQAAHGELSGTAPHLVYRPGPDFHGVDSFTFRANDTNADSNVAIVSITVEPVNDAPIAHGDEVAIDEDVALDIVPSVVLANDTDADNDALSVIDVAAGPDTHGRVSLVGGRIHYVPDANYNGPASFDYTVADGAGGSDGAAVTLSVRPMNDAPIVVLVGPDELDEGAPAVTFTASASDIDGDSLTYTWSASGGVLTPSGPTATYTADDGPASPVLTVSVADGSSTAFASRTVAVRNVAPSVHAGNDVSEYWGLPLSLTGSASDPSNADTVAGLAGAWTFGDGSPQVLAATASHAYAEPGKYTATFSATDKDEGVGSDTAAVTIEQRGTRVVEVGPAAVLASTASVSARLVDDVDGATARVAGRTLGLALGSSTCTAVTDPSGLASCTLDLTGQTLGSATLGANFAGDSLYTASDATAKTLLYAWPTGVSFALGDLSTSGGVTFWDAQWAELNSLSGGAAPASFKGYVNTTSGRSCGTGWKTDPGNSSDPPATVPPYMGALVTTSVTKQGSTISGDTVRVVVVKTDPGYGPSPGHQGTGTVIASVC